MVTGFQFLNGPAWAPDDTLLFSDTPTDRQLRFTPGKSAPSEVASHAGGISATTFDSKGNTYVAGRKSPRSLYNPHIATMEADPTKAYNQDDATGFIRLNGLRLRVNSTVNGAKNLKAL